MWCLSTGTGSALRLGRTLFNKRALLVYGADSALGCRTAALLQGLDVLGGLEYKAVDRAQDPGLTFHLESMPQGWRCWGALVARVPLALPVLPLLAAFGRGSATAVAVASAAASKPVALAGALMLGVNLLCGFLLIDTWPFAVYPTFASMDRPQAASLVLVALNAEGEAISELVPLANGPCVRLTGLRLDCEPCSTRS
jgi:hypothetical protein